MRNSSYNMEIKEHETRKEDNVENMKSQSSSSEKLGHSKKLMKKIEQPEHNGSHDTSSRFTFFEAYPGSCGNNRVYTLSI
jgi:hypothetical protein